MAPWAWYVPVFVSGLFVGTMIGIFVAALCAAAQRGEALEHNSNH